MKQEETALPPDIQATAPLPIRWLWVVKNASFAGLVGPAWASPPPGGQLPCLGTGEGPHSR